MGHFSDQSIIEAEQRLDLRAIHDKRVCAACFDDLHIAEFIRNHAIGHACDYCAKHGEEVAAAPLPEVLDFMLTQIELEYTSADQSLPRDPETKDRMFPENEFPTRDMLESYVGLELPNDHRGTLMDAIEGALPEQDWCLINPLGARDNEAISNSWDAFKTVVKHRRRFFFLQHKDRDLERNLMWGEAAYDVPELLQRIMAFTQDHGLLVRLPAGSRWIRVQSMSDDDAAFGSKRMGPPPYALAKLPNRMSPAGVPMFYGAIDRETALAEIADVTGKFASGIFETMKDITILDVRVAPEVPSLFDPEFAKDRAVAMFMHAFVSDFRAPIDRNLKPHVDYLPTQVITEYFRTMALDKGGEPILGVRYSSTKNGKDAIVLFAENADVVDDGAHIEADSPWLSMVAYEEVLHHVTKPDAADIA